MTFKQRWYSIQEKWSETIPWLKEIKEIWLPRKTPWRDPQWNSQEIAEMMEQSGGRPALVINKLMGEAMIRELARGNSKIRVIP